MTETHQVMLRSAEAITILLASTLSCIASAYFENPAWSLASLALYLWTCIFLFRSATQAFVLAAPVLLVRLSTFIAFVPIEFGSRIPELTATGTPGTAATSYLLVTLLGLIVYVLAFRLVSGRNPRSTHSLTPLYDQFANLFSLALISMISLLILALLARGALTGFPLMAGIDRLQYRRNTDLITLYTLNDKAILLLLAGMVTFRLPVARSIRLMSVSVSILLLASCFLFGDKFFSQIGGVVAFLTPYLYTNHAVLSRRIGRLATGGLFIVGLAFTVTWFIYSANGTMTTAATMERLGGRIVGQGEIWWQQSRVDNNLVGWDGDFLQRNLRALKTKEIEAFALQNSLGPNYFSNQYAPPAIRTSMVHGGGIATYTIASEAIALANFGWLGLVLAVCAVSFIWALLNSYVAYAIRSRSLISVALGSFVLLGFTTMMFQASPWTFFGLYAMKWYVIVVFIEVALATIGASQLSNVPSTKPYVKP